MSVHASSLFNVTGFSVLMGLSSAMETLCGQVSTGLSRPHKETLVLTFTTFCRTLGLGIMPRLASSCSALFLSQALCLP